jgi:predicted RNA-binding protein
MCEFKVYLDGKKIFQDVIYARVDGNDLVLRDVLGEVQKVTDSRVVEIDVSSARLVIEQMSK